MRYMRNAYTVLFGKTEGKIPIGRPKRRREDSRPIKMDLSEIRWKDVDWIHLAQDRDRFRALVNTVMNLQVPQKARDFLSKYDQLFKKDSAPWS
jgi:hypothetical protein